MDRLPSRLSVAKPAAAGGWTPRRLRAARGRLCQALDLILLGGAFGGLVLFPHLRHGEGFFRELLQLRFSLRDIVIAIFCVSTWHVVLTTVGVYSPRPTSSIRDYVFRCVIGLNSCTGVVGLIEVVLGGRGTVWRVAGSFWIAGLVSMAATRLALAGLDRALPVGSRRRSG